MTGVSPREQRSLRESHIVDESFLPAGPRIDACKRCDYRPICGPYEEERVTRKSQAELQPLKELRGQA